MRTIYKILILMVIFMICGCFRLKSDDYHKQDTQSQHLNMPAGLDSGKIDEYYPVPDVKKPSANADAVSLIPPGSKIKK